MEVGIGGFPQEAFNSTRELLSVCEKVEGYGFDRLWMADSQGIWPDPYTLLGRLADKTERIALGVGVSNPRTRHPAVLARSAVTVTDLAGERLLLGIGAGNTALLHLGMPPADLANCREVVSCVRDLIQGKEGTFGGHPVPAFNHDRLVRIPVCLAANGPKMLELAGEVADGAIVSAGISPEILRWVKSCIESGLKKSGRGWPEFQLIVFVGCAVSVDRPETRRNIRAWVARRLSMPIPEAVSGIPKAARIRALKDYQYTQHYRVTASHQGVVDTIPDEWIDRFGIAGTPEECAERFSSIAGLGADAVFILPITDDSDSYMKTLAAGVLPQVSHRGDLRRD